MQIDTATLQATYKSALYTSGSFSIAGSALEITGNASSASSDNVTVSDAAKKLLDRAKSLDIFKIIFPNGDVSKPYKTLDEVEGDFNQDFTNFSSWFGGLSGMLGLDDAGSLTMGLNGVGGVDVSGSDSAAASKVEGAFSGNSALVSRFAVMAARAALVDARSTVDGFDAEYSSDPVAAIKDNIDALKERLLGFRTVSGEGEMQYGFMRRYAADIEFSSLTANYGSGSSEAGETVSQEPENSADVLDF